jgi:hypothetical protein
MVVIQCPENTHSSMAFLSPEALVAPLINVASLASEQKHDEHREQKFSMVSMATILERKE